MNFDNSIIELFGREKLDRIYEPNAQILNSLDNFYIYIVNLSVALSIFFIIISFFLIYFINKKSN